MLVVSFILCIYFHTNVVCPSFSIFIQYRFQTCIVHYLQYTNPHGPFSHACYCLPHELLLFFVISLQTQTLLFVIFFTWCTKASLPCHCKGWFCGILQLVPCSCEMPVQVTGNQSHSVCHDLWSSPSSVNVIHEPKRQSFYTSTQLGVHILAQFYI